MPRISAAPMDSITKEDFEAFVEVRDSGRTNMMMIRNVAALSGLDEGTAMGILCNFDALAKKFPGVA